MISREGRTRIMKGVRSKDTSLEHIVRRELFALGYRYRLHGEGLPGRPDIVFPGLRKVIFVHGCFWHQHVGCVRRKTPRTNTEYWLPKLKRNKQRDKQAVAALQRMGWRVAVIWECEIKDSKRQVCAQLARFLKSEQ
jgi:DNA mismatch endonuclease, patch repair protein